MPHLMKFLLLASLAAISGCSRPPDLAAQQERLLARRSGMGRRRRGRAGR